MIEVVASSRATFRAADKVLRFTTPAGSVVGDLLVAIWWSHGSEVPGVDPAGWTSTAAGSPGGTYTTWVSTHVIVRGDAPTVDFALQPAGAVAHEWMGILLVARGGIATIYESNQAQTFAGTAAPATSLATLVEQAIDVVLSLCVAAGAIAVVPNLHDSSGAPVAYETEQLDSWSQRVIESYSMSVAIRRAGETGTLLFSAGSATAPVTGFQSTFVLRAGAPARPAILFDVVPGNLGLLGEDLRGQATNFGASTPDTGGGGGGGTVGPGH